MSKKTLIKRLARNGNEEEANSFLESLDINDIVDLEIELLGDF
jgi:hypothetical protein